MKLLVTDIDGTLTSGNTLPQPVAEACARLRVRGWRIMIATGRIWASARPFIEATGSDLPAIVYDGARIMGARGDWGIGEWRIDRKVAGKVLSLGWESHLLVQAYGDEEVTCRPDDGVTREFFGNLGVRVVQNLVTPSLSFDPFRIIFYGDPAEARSLAGKINELLGEKVEVTLAGEGFLDVLAPGVSKGRALNSFKKSCGYRIDRVVAAGDHLNDLELLKEADLAVTFRDAPQEVLEASHLVLPPASRMGFLELCRFLEKSDADPASLEKGFSCRRGVPLHLGTSHA